MSEPRVHRMRSWAVVRALGVGVAVALAAAGCGGGGAASGASAPSVPSSPVSTVPATSSSGGGSTAQSAGDLSGNWVGRYDGTFTGTFSLNWNQTGSKLAGTIKLSTAGTVPVNGSVNGDKITFGTVGSTAITYNGTVSGQTMSGTYSTPSGGGSWSAHRP